MDKNTPKFRILKRIILVVAICIIASKLGAIIGKSDENRTNPTYDKENYATLNNNTLSSNLLGLEINLPDTWDVMSDKKYNEEYYEKFPQDRRIPKTNTDEKFIKGFVAFDKNSKDYISFGFMRMALDYDANTANPDIVNSLKEKEQYKNVEAGTTIIGGKTINTIYAEVEVGQYHNKQRWYVYQSGRMILQIVAVTHNNSLKNIENIINNINFK